MPKRKSILSLAALFTLYSTMQAALPMGPIEFSGMQSAKPPLMTRIWNAISMNSPKAKALQEYIDMHQPLLDSLAPEGNRLDGRLDLGGYEIIEEKEEEYVPTGTVLSLDRRLFCHTFNEELDYYSITDRTHLRSPVIEVLTVYNRPDSIIRITEYVGSGHKRIIPVNGKKFLHDQDLWLGSNPDSSTFNFAKEKVQEFYQRFHLDELLPLMEDITLPDYPQGTVPFEAVITNVPVMADRRKRSEIERSIEEMTERKRQASLTRARNRILEQHAAGQDVLIAPADSLFASKDLYTLYAKAMQDPGYREGFLEPAEKAFALLSTYKEEFVQDFPATYTLVGLGGDDATYDVKIMKAARWYGKRATAYWNLDDEAAVLRSIETMEGQYGVRSTGVSLDLSEDQAALDEVLKSIPGPRVFFTKDTDINWPAPLKMYNTLYANMQEEDVLIRAAAREHDRMHNTYNGIGPFATAYLQHLSLDPAKWEFQGCRYDTAEQQWQNDFIAQEMDMLQSGGNVALLGKGQVLRHLLSSRKDLRPELEQIGFTFLRGITVPGYGIDVYLKEGCR